MSLFCIKLLTASPNASPLVSIAVFIAFVILEVNSLYELTDDCYSIDDANFIANYISVDLVIS